jgi:hypothetical protein
MTSDHTQTPGRSCPLRYRYGAAAIARAPLVEADTLYVVGGLYGNVEALETIERMVANEKGVVRLCFNGDFNWFNVDDESFRKVMSRVLRHDAVLGNVEAELGAEGDDAGCGCAYPDSVDAAVVERSNRIHARLKETASRHPDLTARLAALPMFARYQVGDCQIGIVHGDADSLAGWRFSRADLAQPDSTQWLKQAFEQADVDVFASSHTCEPVLHPVYRDEALGAVINNGAAGMPNYPGQRVGLITRISRTAVERSSLLGTSVSGRLVIKGVEVAAITVPYRHEIWQSRFLANWPEGSDAHVSYYARIMGTF